MRSFPNLRAFFADRARMLVGSEATHLVRDAMPMPIYAGGLLRIVTDQRANQTRIGHVTRALADLGVTELTARIATVSAPSSDRIVAQVHMVHRRNGQHTGAFSDVVYYLQLHSDTLRTEMIDIIDCPALGLAEKQRQHTHI